MSRLARAACAAVLAASCAAPARPKAVPSATIVAAPTIERPWRYQVTADDGGRTLAVDAVLFAPGGGDFSLERGAPFASTIELSTGGPFAPVPEARDAGGDAVFRLPPCPPDGCRVRYRFDVARAAGTRDVGVAQAGHGLTVTSPGAWLLHPTEYDAGQSFELQVTTPPGTTFVSGLGPAGNGDIALPPAGYRADVADLVNPAWAAIGRMRLVRAEVEGEIVDVAVEDDGPLATQPELVRAWVEDAARAVRDYYGRASIRRLLLVVEHGHGRGMSFGRTLGNGGATIVAVVGRSSALADLTSGWELIHELLHVSFPKLARDHAWLEEGMATYVEPLIRVRRGTIPAVEAFLRFVQRMPFGLAEAGDRGLDHTHSWGRTYWGGAIFCLLADVAIRERTGGRRSLDDALRAVLAKGGNVADRWDIERVLAVGDEATGTTVLRDVYAQMGNAAPLVDLDYVWRRLGVVPKDDGVVFDDRAELAWIRRAMVAKDGR